MKLCSTALLGLVSFGILSYTSVHADTLTPAQYCIDKGGKVETMVAEFSTQSGMVYGFDKKFCTFDKDNGSIVVGLKTFASERPNLGATLIQKLPKIEASSPLWKGNYANPSLNVCKNMGGSSISFFVMSGGFTSSLGQNDVCVFGDGSMVSAWTLVYFANGRTGYDDVKREVRSEPLSISMPQ